MGKILLLFPNIFFGHYMAGEVPIHQPVGLAYLAAVLREKGHQVSVIDAAAERLSIPRLVKRVAAIDPEAIGITTNLGISDKAAYTARILKREFPRSRIIMGGPWATIEFDKILSKGYADVVVIGEGEVTAPELLSRIHDRERWGEVDGIAYVGGDGKIAKTRPRGPVADLDSLPFPAWDLFPPSTRYPLMHRRDPYYPVLTSRGCPYDCIHCTKAVHGYKFRARSVKSVIDEIRYLNDTFHAREIIIIDDVFNLDVRRAKAIMDEIVKNEFDLSINFTNGIRADKLDDGLVRRFRIAGVYSAALGIESGNQAVVDHIGKRLNLAKVIEGVNLLKRHGIGTRGFFILGHPQDSFQTMIQTLHFAKRLDLDYPHFFKFIPFPGTKAYDLIKAEGTFHRDASAAAKDAYNLKAFSFDIWNLKAEDVEKAFEQAYMLFYLRPRKIMQLLSKIRSLSELGWLFRSFMNIIVRNLL